MTNPNGRGQGLKEPDEHYIDTGTRGTMSSKFMMPKFLTTVEQNQEPMDLPMNTARNELDVTAIASSPHEMIQCPSYSGTPLFPLPTNAPQ
jgi:hypothetical protein